MRHVRDAIRISGIALLAALGLMCLFIAADPGRDGSGINALQLVATLVIWVLVAVGAPFLALALARRAARRRDAAAEVADEVARRRAQLIGGLTAAAAVALCWPLAPVIASSDGAILLVSWMLAAITGLLFYLQATGHWKTGIGPIW